MKCLPFFFSARCGPKSAKPPFPVDNGRKRDNNPQPSINGCCRARDTATHAHAYHRNAIRVDGWDCLQKQTRNSI
jgi:hypothetical protein